MCLLIVDQKGAGIPAKIAQRAAIGNPDGYGRLDLDTGQIRQTMDRDEALHLCALPGAAVHHYRWATAGTVGLHGCHPHPISGPWHLFHNGHLSDIEVNDKRPDTAHLADILAHVRPAKRAEVLWRFSSKFALVNAKSGEVIRTGSGWVKDHGVWYSNGSCLYEPKPKHRGNTMPRWDGTFDTRSIAAGVLSRDFTNDPPSFSEDLACPDCGSFEVLEDQGYLACEMCGAWGLDSEAHKWKEARAFVRAEILAEHTDI